MEQQIQHYLNKVDRVRPLEQLLTAPIKKTDTIEYYTKVNKYYRGFHSKEGAMHAPIYEVKGELRHHEALYEQARFVQKMMQQASVAEVLELGCGTGYNSQYLAGKNPGVNFTGLDLTPLHIKKAKAESNSLRNLNFVEGDFQNLPFESGSFDLAFAVETICHAEDVEAVYKEIYRVLKPGGRLIVFDGYATAKAEAASQAVWNAGLLVAYGFAIAKPQIFPKVEQAIRRSGFEIRELTDLTKAILPNVLSFQKGTKVFFRFPLLTRLLLRMGLMSKSFFRHLLAGLFSPFLIKGGYTVYYRMVLKK